MLFSLNEEPGKWKEPKKCTVFVLGEDSAE
jgi:hypothetical protein